MDDKKNLPRARSQKQCNGYLALVETKTKTRAMPTGQY